MAARISVQARDPAAWPSDCIHVGTDALARQNPHPQDAEIRFDEGPHLYYVRGSETPVQISVTGICHSLFPAKSSRDFLQMNEQTRQTKYANMSDDDILRQWKRDADAASASGTMMHAAIETFFNTFDRQLRWGFLSRDPRLQIEMSMFRSWMQREFLPRGLVPFRTEMLVFGGSDESTTVAGSIDFVAQRLAPDGSKTDEFFIFDWKRAKDLKISVQGKFGWSDMLPQFKLENTNFVHYSIQLHVYRYIMMHFFNFPPIPVANLYLVVLHPSQTSYKMVQCADVSHVIPEIFRRMPDVIERYKQQKQKH